MWAYTGSTPVQSGLSSSVSLQSAYMMMISRFRCWAKNSGIKKAQTTDSLSKFVGATIVVTV